MGDDAVGYKRPPSEHQFRPGESGNPAGRPKRRPTFSSVLLAELAASMPGNQHARTGSKLEALVRKLVNSAIAGNGRAQQLVVTVLTRLGEPEAHELAPLSSDDQKILDEYIGLELKRRSAEAGVATPPSENKQDVSSPAISTSSKTQ
jgi:hypothetical protein